MVAIVLGYTRHRNWLSFFRLWELTHARQIKDRKSEGSWHEEGENGYKKMKNFTYHSHITHFLIFFLHQMCGAWMISRRTQLVEEE